MILPPVIFSSKPGETFHHIDISNEYFSILPHSYAVSSDAISDLRN